MDADKKSPDHCVGGDQLHFIFLWATKFLSSTREDFLQKLDSVWRCGEIVRDQSLIISSFFDLATGFSVFEFGSAFATLECLSFPCTQRVQSWTVYCKIPRALRWARTRHCWRPIESHRDQISRRSRFCNHALFFSLFSSSCVRFLRHGSKVINLAEMATRKHWMNLFVE